MPKFDSLRRLNMADEEDDSNPGSSCSSRQLLVGGA